MKKPWQKWEIKAAIRGSLLSQKQAEEIERALCAYFPGVSIQKLCTSSTGDLDQITSLRSQENTDFFTKEIDEKVLSGLADVAIHSAKDMPSALPDGLEIIALTEGIDPTDSLVFRKGISLSSFPCKGRVGASSIRREEMVKKTLPQAVFVDIRGSVPKRLARLRIDLDAVVVAEAALLRLGSSLFRIPLEGKTHPMQGRLAVVAKTSCTAVKKLFSTIDGR